MIATYLGVLGLVELLALCYYTDISIDCHYSVSVVVITSAVLNLVIKAVFMIDIGIYMGLFDKYLIRCYFVARFITTTVAELIVYNEVSICVVNKHPNYEWVFRLIRAEVLIGWFYITICWLKKN